MLNKKKESTPREILFFSFKKYPMLIHKEIIKILPSLAFIFIYSCDGIMRIQNNVFIKHNINSQTYYSKYSGECDVYFNLLQIKGVAFNPDPKRIIYRRKVNVEEGILDLSEITWSKESKYMIHLKCNRYKEVTKIFNYPSIEPSYFYFELEQEN
ncbi:hypothetical protein P3G55_18365 [Leptospira sp. 96542]|nr:hypothetical protein [Leptospira sp. 96542]